MDIFNLHATSFLDLDPIQLGLYALIVVSEAIGLILIAVWIKYRIRWGKIYLERYVIGWVAGFLVYLFIILNFQYWAIFAFTFGITLGLIFAACFFNIVNKDIRLIYFLKFDILFNSVVLKKFMCYKETVDEKIWVAIPLNEEGKEPFKNLIKRIFGIRRRILILNSGTPFECNDFALLYTYREFGIEEETGDYGYFIEPNVRHSDAAFLKAYDGYFSEKTQIDALNDEIKTYQMNMFNLARKYTGDTLDPFFKFLYSKYYASFARLKIFRDAETDLRIKEIEKELRDKTKEQEEEFKKKFKVVDERKELVLEEGKFRLE